MAQSGYGNTNQSMLRSREIFLINMTFIVVVGFSVGLSGGFQRWYSVSEGK